MGLCFRKMIPKQKFCNDDSTYNTPLNYKDSCEMSNNVKVQSSMNGTLTSSSSFNDYIDEDEDDNNDLTYDLYDPSETLTTDFSSNTLADVGTMKLTLDVDFNRDFRVNRMSKTTQNLHSHKRYTSLTTPEIKNDKSMSIFVINQIIWLLIS